MDSLVIVVGHVGFDRLTGLGQRIPQIRPNFFFLDRADDPLDVRI